MIKAARLKKKKDNFVSDRISRVHILRLETIRWYPEEMGVAKCCDCKKWVPLDQMGVKRCDSCRVSYKKRYYKQRQIDIWQDKKDKINRIFEKYGEPTAV